jgi:LmbE family N-acetylglucosaminyl deacetylase
VTGFSRIISEIAPERIYLPHPSDSLSDHRIAFEAAAACTKWFRYNSIRQVLAHETLSETRFGIDPGIQALHANHYVDISEHLDGKIAALSLYGDEFGAHPFPRSEDGVRALAKLRGGESGCMAAEAFMLLRAIET